MSLGSNWPILAVGGAILYFATNVVTGDQGLAKWSELQQTEQTVQAELEVAQQELAALNERAAKLKNDQLDLDLIDERARALLGYAENDEVVFFLTKATATGQTP